MLPLNIKSKTSGETWAVSVVVRSRDPGTRLPGINPSSAIQYTGQIINFSMVSFLGVKNGDNNSTYLRRLLW